MTSENYLRRSHFGTKRQLCDTLPRLISLIITESNVSAQASLIDAFLHTYRLFTETLTVSDLIVSKFHDICHSKNINADQRLLLINSLRLFLQRWLQPPHAQDFNSHCGLAWLRRMTSIIAEWCITVHPKHSFDTPESTRSAWCRMFTGADIKLFHKVTHELDELGQSAAELEEKIRVSVAPSKLLVPRSSDACPPGTNHKINLARLNPRQLAYEITMQDHKRFSRLLLPECLLYVRKQPSPTVQNTIQQFNRIVNIVQMSILQSSLHFSEDTGTIASHEQSHQRTNFSGTEFSFRTRKQNGFTQHANEKKTTLYPTRMISLWIEVADELDRLNNLSSLKAVITGLQTNAIYRLRKNWGQIETMYSAHSKKFEELQSVVSTDNNSEKLRARIKKYLFDLRNSERMRRKTSIHSMNSDADSSIHLRRANNKARTMTGLIPYLGIYFKDLTFLHHAFPDWVPARHVADSGSTRSDSHSEVSSIPLRPKLRVYEHFAASTNSLPEAVAKYQATPYLQPGTCDRSPSSQALFFKSPNNEFVSSSSVSDHSPPKLINFDKHLREAEFLRDLALLQYSCEQYKLQSDELTSNWLNSFPSLSSDEIYQLSLKVEPSDEVPKPSSPTTQNLQNLFVMVSKLGMRQLGPSPSDPGRTRSSNHNAFVKSSSMDSGAHVSRPTSPAIIITDTSSDSQPANMWGSQDHVRSFGEKRTHSVPHFHDTRSRSPRTASRSRSGSRTPAHLTIQVVLCDTSRLIPTKFKPWKPLKKTESASNLIDALATPYATDGASITENITNTDTTQDVLLRVLAKFGLPSEDVGKYDLVQTRMGVTDRVLPLRRNAFDVLSTPLLPNNAHLRPGPVDVLEPIHCACVRKLSGSSTYSERNRPSRSGQRYKPESAVTNRRLSRHESLVSMRAAAN